MNADDLREVVVGKGVFVAEADGETLKFLNERRYALNALKEAGFVTQLENLESDMPSEWGVVCNIERFTSGDELWKDLEPKLGDIRLNTYGGPREKGLTRVEILARIFHGIRPGHIVNKDTEVIRVFSVEDHDHFMNVAHDIEPKPFFYVPKTAKDAFVMSKVQKDPYYLGFWQLGGTISEYNPTLDGSKLLTREAAISQLTYNSRLGAGYRDSKGELWALSQNERQNERTYKKMSTGFFASWKYQGKPNPKNDSGKRLSLNVSPKEYIMQCPNLRSSNSKGKPFLTEHDFKSLPGDRFTKSQTPTGKGLIQIEGTQARLNIGKEYADGSYVVQKVSNRYAVVIKIDGNSMKPQQIIDLDALPQNETYIGKEEVPMVSTDQFIQDKPQLAVLIERFDEYMSFVSSMSTESGFNITKMDLSLQGYAFVIHDQMKFNKNYWSFLGSTRLNGLKAMVICLRAGEDPSSIFSMASKSESAWLWEESAALLDRMITLEDRVARTITLNDSDRADMRAMDAAALNQVVVVFKLAKNMLLQKKQIKRISDLKPMIQNLNAGIQQWYQSHLISPDLPVVKDIGAISGEIQLQSLIAAFTEHGSEVTDVSWNEMVAYYEKNPQQLYDGMIYFSGKQNIAYRILARGKFTENDIKRTLGTALTLGDVGDEIDGLRSLLRDPTVLNEERQHIDTLLQTVLNLVGQKMYGDTNEFYADLRDYNNDISDTLEMRQNKYKALLTLISKKTDVKSNDLIWDLATGPGDFVKALIEERYTNVVGMDINPAFISDAQEKYGNHFQIANWYALPQGQVKLITCNTRSEGHAVGLRQKRAMFREVADHLIPGGYFIMDSANILKEGSEYHKNMMGYREVLRALGVPEDQVKTSYYVVDTPDKPEPGRKPKHFMNRSFLPEPLMTAVAKDSGMKLVTVIKTPMTHLLNDESIQYVFRKI